MNVASLELCRTLFELSGWEGDRISWGSDGKIYAGDEQVYAFAEGIKFTVAYDLGYLLRKLPQAIEDSNAASWMLKIEHPSHGWNAYYYGDVQGGVADTPEDALCSLAIELFKQGVLSK